MSGARVREMTPADCDRVARIRVAGWQSAYRGLMPQSYLDGMSAADNAGRLRARLAAGDGSVQNLVAVGAAPAPTGHPGRDDEIVGWACHGPYRDGEVRTDDAELYALYVDPRHQGRGIGRALLDESVRRCTAAGRRRVFLWVLEENAPARRFYARGGFHADGAAEPFEVAGVEVPEVRYVKELGSPG
ncbi:MULTISPECIES: GNAT family N-acetyltransferase [Streptomyces]|uniref:GNAT family N-acetyltransferase n=1 Tax=Streptomyces TaxID=1883 RepID=UPI0006AE1E5A|nr:GNAT family N-acetyltransferase [Streptomyces sp. AS58]